ncbi:hypothetical protein KBY93_01220 [Synechococcus sp. J7-Johnson]|nr:hypothetical protein [Synechococcus sp. J7-Johnson]MCP9839253.1 hypothetical protein [Synechococcus sp. J7-Johnson]
MRSSKDYSAEQRADAANDLPQRAARNPRPDVPSPKQETAVQKLVNE